MNLRQIIFIICTTGIILLNSYLFSQELAEDNAENNIEESTEAISEDINGEISGENDVQDNDEGIEEPAESFFIDQEEQDRLDEMLDSSAQPVFIDLSRQSTNFFAGNDLFQEDDPLYNEEPFMETPVRRFEIIIFIAFPFAFLYNELIIQGFVQNVYKFGDERRGDITDPMWIYIVAASIILSAGIAYDDYLFTFEADRMDENYYLDRDFQRMYYNPSFTMPIFSAAF